MQHEMQHADGVACTKHHMIICAYCAYIALGKNLGLPNNRQPYFFLFVKIHIMERKCCTTIHIDIFDEICYTVVTVERLSLTGGMSSDWSRGTSGCVRIENSVFSL